MAYTFNTLLSSSRNYGSNRSASSIRYLIFHYTGNRTDTAKANANYFHTRIVKASAHYFVDNTTVYQSVPDLKVAWAVGGKKYSDCSKTGGGSMYRKITNTNSISIEMCSTNGVISDSTIANAVILGKALMAKYGIDINHVYEHFDITGKKCIGWAGWIGSDRSKWYAFKSLLSSSATIPTTPSSPTVSNQTAIIKAVQTWLKVYTGVAISIDGQVGTNTKKVANKALQKALNEFITVYNKTSRTKLRLLTVDGIIGTSSKSAIAKFGTIRVGSTGNLVKVVESFLYLRGYNPAEYRGLFNASVAAATKEFQKDKGLVQDGIVGLNTYNKLIY